MYIIAVYDCNNVHFGGKINLKKKTVMTTENNKIIAEFMGIVFTKENKANHPRIKAPYPPIECFKYHSDWNWLMEVVEKIKSIVSLMEIPYTNELIAGLITVNKEAVYIACLEFIKWYNEQNK